MFRDEAETLDDDSRPPRPAFETFDIIQGRAVDGPMTPDIESKI